MGKVRLVVVPLVLVAACTSGGSTRSSSPSAHGVVLAVSRHGDAGVQLYEVGADRRARLLRDVRPPAQDRHALAWTLSGGARPDLCVVWDLTSDGYYGELSCYPFGQPARSVDPAVGRAVGGVALRADGKALAWTTTTDEAGDVRDVVVADYSKGRATHARALNKGKDKSAWQEEWTDGVAWATDHVLVLERPLQDDQPGGYELVDLNRIAPGGWGENALAVDPEPSEAARRYDYFTAVQSATVDWVLAIEGSLCDVACTGLPPTRAVRVAIGSGRVLEVVATAAKGRVISSVSGSLYGVAYTTTTTAGRDVRVYLRLKAESHGVLVTGLPPDVTTVVAQP